MTTSYTALVDVGDVDVDVDTTIESLVLYDAVFVATSHGTTEVVLTVEALSLVTAATTALTLVAVAVDEPQAISVMTTGAFDERQRGLAS